MARRNRTPSPIFIDAGTLDISVCERARVGRNRGYDGLFLTAIASRLSTFTTQIAFRSTSKHNGAERVGSVGKGH
jgi:hypothetical protein